MRQITIGLLTALLLAAPFLSAAEPPGPPKADVAAVVKGDNEFAFDLYAQLRTKDGNVFFSPYSISSALAMTYAGARGQTAEEMAKTLHFTLEQERLHLAMGSLARAIKGDGKKRGYQLSTANALWAQKGYPFSNEYLKLTEDCYKAGIHEVDFEKATEDSRKTINAWVEKETQDKIKEILKPGTVTAKTRLVLSNAIYFKGDWDRQFKKDRTTDESFQVAADKKVDAKLMHQEGPFGYFDGGSFQLLEMPYVGKDLSMVVLLPKKVDGLPDLEKSLTNEKMSGWLGKAAREDVRVSLPKFKATTEYGLSDTLDKMGMHAAFGSNADFSGITGGKESLSISVVIHKAFVEVNEEGTEAAAATVVGVDPRAVKVIPAFRADHPFVFVILDKRSDSMLFLGRIVNPQ